MNLEELKEKLREYKKKDIIITDHAKIRALIREINLDDVKENIINPKNWFMFLNKKQKNHMKRNMNVILPIQKIIVISMF